ncbi:pyridoxamine 5'-phosphate oxidase family protein [Azonexus sp.]|jgi:nitroimidazol reductase NimA-like FMN-containing flavoprotein (pyridoxamine 5'-phosphate oxidase superfamily)|uniref:pyridoxamine 5'-phosphate oxidase family protein n=1 Tax=Azonexus sp. TaxID=1872668 RepID=UPI0028386AB2|nr:pyridoxamine 5'-phosphate oxidase family protein [Azonexus sp.]MDR1996170.1 pyridoxamine 5'-phosphate oxidase family protein [Azonexus sp.]
MSPTAPSPRTVIHRKPQRAHYDAATIAAIIDTTLICQIAFNQGGSVHCLPTACWRIGNALYIHGANNSRLTQTLLSTECAVCIAHVDGLVFARSALHHSMNYRSVVIYGRFAAVDAPSEKAAALAAFVDHVSPGRTALVRPPNTAELAGTRVLRLALDEAVAKTRDWGVVDDAEDLALPVWAGVVLLQISAGMAQAEVGCAGQPQPALPAFLTTAQRTSPTPDPAPEQS